MKILFRILFGPGTAVNNHAPPLALNSPLPPDAAFDTCHNVKAMSEVTLSARNQIVLPREARHALGVKAGDKLVLVVRGATVTLLQKPTAHTAIRGLGRGVWPRDYLRRERQSWD